MLVSQLLKLHLGILFVLFFNKKEKSWRKDRPQIKNDDKFEALKREGMSKEKAVRIANATNSGKKDGRVSKYEDRTKNELYKKGKEVVIDGRAKMSKHELINALRNH